jgi:magnesium transporter
MYFVGFSSATIVASLILFQGFNTTDGTNTLSLLAGFFIIFIGVHLLNLSRQSESLEPDHSALESGIMNPRLSLQGRPSLDGWTGMPITPTSARRQGHGRNGSNSHYRSQSATLFDAFDEGGVDGNATATGGVRDGVALNRIPKTHPTTRRELEVTREEDEETDEDDDDEDDEEDADERTQLRRDRPTSGKAGGHISPGSLSRSHSRSPMSSHGRPLWNMYRAWMAFSFLCV